MIQLNVGVPMVDVQRSGVVESVHSGHVVVLDAFGSILTELGDVRQPIFARSSVKPLQGAGMLRAGLELPADQLALAVASHSGEAIHLETVRAILAGGALGADALQCPADWPLGEAARMARIAGGGHPEPITMNCSGKHAAMLRTCLVNGWPTEEYPSPTHPLQVSLSTAVAELCGEPVAATGVDGCGAPLFAFSLLGLARAFGRLATAEGSDGLIANAMRAHPLLVAGTGRSATALMTAVPGLIAKDGAEGVYAAALPDGSAVALKIDDGALRAAEPMIVAALRSLGVEVSLPLTPLLGGGRPVGSVHVRPGLFEGR